MEDYDQESKAKRKKEQIEFRNKKRTSSIFMFFATIFEIIETLLLIILAYIALVFIISRVFPADSKVAGTIFQIGTVVIFIGGMILGFLIYKKVVVFAIKKMKLEDKLSDDVLNHYIRKTDDEIKEELKK